MTKLVNIQLIIYVFDNIKQHSYLSAKPVLFGKILFILKVWIVFKHDYVLN